MALLAVRLITLAASAASRRRCDTGAAPLLLLLLLLLRMMAPLLATLTGRFSRRRFLASLLSMRGVVLYFNQPTKKINGKP